MKQGLGYRNRLNTTKLPTEMTLLIATSRGRFPRANREAPLLIDRVLPVSRDFFSLVAWRMSLKRVKTGGDFALVVSYACLFTEPFILGDAPLCFVVLFEQLFLLVVALLGCLFGQRTGCAWWAQPALSKQ